MDHLFLLQFACFLFMLFNAFTLAVTRLQTRWLNPRYERARWLIFVGIMGLAAHYLMQMRYGFRAVDDAVGATVNALVYAPCFSLISMGIFHIEATHVRRRRVYVVCTTINLAIFACFFIGCFHYGSMRIGAWLYAMQALFAANVVYCIVVIVREIIKRRRLLETMAGGDIMPYVRYSRASLLILFFPAVVSPFAIISTKLLYFFAPLGLMAFLFFVLSFVALGYSYQPKESLLDEEAEGKVSPAAVVAQQEETVAQQAVALHGDACHDGAAHDGDKAKEQQTATLLPEDRRKQIQQRLDEWCAALGYRDGAVNLLLLSHTIHISKDDLTLFFDQCLNTTFRIWLSDIRFAAAKKMMIENPEYSNDIISSECGFSSRTHLYRIFKAREACTPTVWRERYLAGSHDSDASLS
uniref:helix-turn-helix domain-containing protein n=1 Tax=Prevotella sp. TaxID=59823 RepID=UPI003FEF16F8